MCGPIPYNSKISALSRVVLLGLNSENSAGVREVFSIGLSLGGTFCICAILYVKILICAFLESCYSCVID